MGHVNFNYFFLKKTMLNIGEKLLKLRSHKEIAKINYRYQCMCTETHLSMKGKYCNQSKKHWTELKMFSAENMTK